MKIKLLVVFLVYAISNNFALADDSESLGLLPRGSKISIPFKNVTIHAYDIFFDLGTITLSNGHRPQCLLSFNRSGVDRIWNGDLVGITSWIDSSSVQFGRVTYFIFGNYSINGIKLDYMEMNCFPDQGFTIAEFREYLESKGGSLISTKP